MGIVKTGKRLLGNTPIGKILKKRIQNKRVDENKEILAKLSKTKNVRGLEISEAVRQFLGSSHDVQDADWIKKIEAERERMKADNSPIVDGIEKLGLYDQEGEPISKAVMASKPPKPAEMLYWLVRILKPRMVLELGTNVGISSAYIAAAMKINGNQGKVVTMDASPYRQKQAKRVHKNLGLDNVEYVLGLFTDTLADTVKRLEPVDLAFIDGHHQYQPTLDYYAEIKKNVTDNVVFAFDDVRWSDGMKKAWGELGQDKYFDLITDFYVFGLGVAGNKTGGKRESYAFNEMLLA